ncbi:hypothetical protein [Desulfolutivibrio sp.]|uniref:hypothetical protein n=1 Tax=Desulfolutivibrio sp. TaxID=2773296 RepID=UPI002F96243E
MNTFWLTGEEIITKYGLVDFELNNLIINGLDLYDLNTGYKYFDERMVCDRPRISVSINNSNNGMIGEKTTVRIPREKPKKSRLLINSKIDAYGFNRLDHEIVATKAPANCILANFRNVDDPDIAAKVFKRNRYAIYRKQDVEMIVEKYDLTPVGCVKDNTGDVVSRSGKIEDYSKIENDSRLIINESSQVHLNLPASKNIEIKSAGRKKTLTDEECIKILYMHTRDRKSIAQLAKEYSWKNSPFGDSPKFNTAKSRIVEALRRGRALTPDHLQSTSNPFDQG